MPPVVEHDGAVDEHQRDRRPDRVAVRERMPVQEPGRLVREEAHQPAGERGEVGDPRRPERLGERDQVGPRVPAVRHLHRQPFGRVQDPEPIPVEHDDRGGIAGDERVASPTLGTLDALEQDAGSVARERREDADRGGHVGEQLGPHRCERVALGRAFERSSIGPDPHLISFTEHRRAMGEPYPTRTRLSRVREAEPVG